MSGNPELAKFMQERKAYIKIPVEKIIDIDILATVFNKEKLGRKRIVILECGHRTVTINIKRAPCKRCYRMIMEGYDYDAFRNLKTIKDPIEDKEISYDR